MNEETSILAYAVMLVFQTGIIFGIAWWVTSSAATAAWVALAITVGLTAIPLVLSLLVGGIAVITAGIMALTDRPAGATYEQTAAA